MCIYCSYIFITRLLVHNSSPRKYLSNKNLSRYLHDIIITGLGIRDEETLHRKDNQHSDTIEKYYVFIVRNRVIISNQHLDSMRNNISIGQYKLYIKNIEMDTRRVKFYIQREPTKSGFIYFIFFLLTSPTVSPPTTFYVLLIIKYFLSHPKS